MTGGWADGQPNESSACDLRARPWAMSLSVRMSHSSTISAITPDNQHLSTSWMCASRHSHACTEPSTILSMLQSYRGWPIFQLQPLASTYNKLEFDVGPKFLTRPIPTHKWSDPELTWNSGSDPARHIYERLFVLPSAAESFSLSIKWLFTSDANIIVSRPTAFRPNNTSLMLE